MCLFVSVSRLTVFLFVGLTVKYFADGQRSEVGNLTSTSDGLGAATVHASNTGTYHTSVTVTYTRNSARFVESFPITIVAVTDSLTFSVAGFNLKHGEQSTQQISYTATSTLTQPLEITIARSVPGVTFAPRTTQLPGQTTSWFNLMDVTVDNNVRSGEYIADFNVAYSTANTGMFFCLERAPRSLTPLVSSAFSLSAVLPHTFFSCCVSQVV